MFGLRQQLYNSHNNSPANIWIMCNICFCNTLVKITTYKMTQSFLEKSVTNDSAWCWISHLFRVFTTNESPYGHKYWCIWYVKYLSLLWEKSELHDKIYFLKTLFNALNFWIFFFFFIIFLHATFTFTYHHLRLHWRFNFLCEL